MKAIELFELNIKRVSALLDVHKRTYPKGRPVAEGEAADLLRAVIVFEIAALDAYVHKKVMEVVTKIIQDKKRIPEKCVDLITKQFKESDRSRHLLNIAIHDRPERQILKLFEKSLSLQTFQKPEQIQNAFEMMEIKEGWGQIKRSMQPKKGRRKKGRGYDHKKFLLELVERRDDIVHEGDMYLGKKHHSKLKSISRSEVSEGLARLQRIVEALETVG